MPSEKQIRDHLVAEPAARSRARSLAADEATYAPWVSGAYLSNGLPYAHERNEDVLPQLFAQMGLAQGWHAHWYAVARTKRSSPTCAMSSRASSSDTPRMKLSLAILLVLATRAHAGDATAGKAKSIACQACHVAGNAPHLVGQREPYLVEQLTAFKAGDRKNDFMNPIAKQLSETDIANLAAYWSAQATGSDATASAAVTAIKQPRMTFPKDFPKGFTAYHSETDAAHHTMTKSYANAPALTAAKAGKPMPDGSAVIVVSYAVDASGAAGKPTSYSGMEARAGWGKDIPELLQNGDWSYNLWTADRAAKPDVNQAVCLACHKPAAASSYVFTYDQIKTAK